MGDARQMYKSWSYGGYLPPGKRDKHHGNKRHGLARLKVQARRQERKQLNGSAQNEE